MLQWSGQTDITYALSRTDGLFAPSHQWSGDKARQRSRVFSGAQQSWGFDASFEFARASCLISGEPWSTVRVEQRVFGRLLCLLRNDWSLRRLDVCICTDASEKCFAFVVREGCRELASEVGRVSERTRFTRSSRYIRARSRALRSIARDVDIVWSNSDEDEMSLAQRWSCADFPEMSLQLPDSSEWRLVAYGGFFVAHFTRAQVGVCGTQFGTVTLLVRCVVALHLVRHTTHIATLPFGPSTQLELLFLCR